ncbi:DoxX family protein [Segetibacter sp. 3557_3]|uniref:DoxX family protein n=1 Tax=Segetibacter sp. 3557_3 TaxID=2547429 RepID=UPI001A9F1EC9|nr:hypothetical protein [Segetibacter sp. 3557_3]
MNIFNGTFLLRFAAAVILLMHSIPSIVTNDVADFGNRYLNAVGLAPFGLPLAWAIKLSHVASAVCLLFQVFVKWAVLITILILVAGIVMIHFKEGWFVVGFGRNGMEFNFLLIFVLLAIAFPNGFKRNSR